MPLYDRDYMRDKAGPYGGGYGGGIRFGLFKPSPMVKYLLVINLIVFIAQIFLDQPREGYPAGILSGWLGVTVGGFWQVWRYVTSQFLHGGFWHIALNMLGVYMLGTPLERSWGSRRFLTFYLSCGVASGLAFVLIGWLAGLPSAMPIIGASGGVFGLILACAVLFPQFYLILIFFPVPIRLAAALIFGAMVLFVLQAVGAGSPGAAMSHVAHLGGAIAAAVWIWVVPRVSLRAKLGPDGRGRGRWQRKLARQRRQQAEVDRILDKIRARGIDSLSRRDKRRLRRASQRQREEEL